MAEVPFSDPGKTVRAYTGLVRADADAAAALRAHTDASVAAMRELTVRCLQACADAVGPEWVHGWVTSPADDRIRRAVVVVLSWFAPVSDVDPFAAVLSVDQVRAALRARVSDVLPGVDVDAFMADAEVVFAAKRRENTVWVPLFGDSPAPTAGWAETLPRMLGAFEFFDTKKTPAEAIDLAMAAGHTLTYWLGSGRKTDPGVPVARASALLDALHDPAAQTVADLVAAASHGEASGVQSGLVWLTADVNGTPSIVRQLEKRADSDRLDDVVLGKKTLRDVLEASASKWRGDWAGRAAWNADVAHAQASGDVLAYDWLVDAVMQAMPGMDFVSRVVPELLTHAVTVVVSHRAKVSARAAEWAQAIEAAAEAEIAADQKAVQLVDGFITNSAWWTTDQPVTLGRGANGWKDVFSAFRAETNRDPVHLADVAADLGAGWTEWWTFAGAHPVLWDDPETFGPVWDLLAARERVTRLGVVTLTVPSTTHGVRATWFGRKSYWPGTIRDDGSISATIYDGSGLRDITVGWTSRRLTQITRSQAGAVKVSRNDATARLAAGAPEHGPVSVDSAIDGASFTMRADDSGALRLTVVLHHDTPRRDNAALATDERSVLGVHLGTRIDASWAVWDSITPQRPEPGDTELIRVQGRPARRVGSTKAPIQFGTPVADGTISLAGRDRWANDDEKAAAGRVLHRLDGLRCNATASVAALGAAQGDVSRHQLVTAATDAVTVGLKANKLLAHIAADSGNDPGGHPQWERLDKLWPVDAAADLAAVWADRDRHLSDSMVDVRRRLVMGGGHQLGSSFARLAELDALVTLVARWATRPTPVDTSARTRPPGTAASLLEKRARVRGAWAAQLASDIVKTALEQDVDVIAFSEESLPGISPLRSRKANQRLASYARRDVVLRTTQLAVLHGLKVDTVTTGIPRQVIATGVPCTPVLECGVSQALRHYESSAWKRSVTRAKLALLNDDADPVAAAVLATNDHLRAVAGLVADVPAKERRDWYTSHRKHTIMLPHPAGATLVPVTELPSPTSGAITWRWQTRHSRDVQTSHAISWRGMRRRLPQS